MAKANSKKVDQVQSILNEMRTELHNRVKDLSNDKYKEVLEELVTDHEAALESLESEEEEEDDE